MKKLFIAAVIVFLFPKYAISQELPKANQEHCFYLFPLFEELREGTLSFDEKTAQMVKMKNQMGQSNLYHRLGFSMIYSADNTEFDDIAYLLDKNGLQMGIIFDLQSHTREDYRSFAYQDLRFYQWRNNGEDWQGSPEDQRSYRVPTPSRLATPLRDFNKEKAFEWAQSVLKLMNKYPGIVALINGPIEEELAGGEFSSTNDFSDYSPFAITEFRDWLRHTGIYDDSSGEFAGEGAPENIIGELIEFNGVFRSQFYDDPTPYESNGTGKSFNEVFKTSFNTWTLKYWDLLMFPDPITDESFDPTPETGEGLILGGFDAPRIQHMKNPFWRAWSFEVYSNDDTYPPGNPENPAFGFRQNLVRNYVRDLFDWMAEAGIPANMMFAHQIPVEAIHNELRELSSASPVWTGYMDKYGTVGITRFDDINPELMTQYADRWGIFEWHSSPEADPDTQELYDKSINALNLYYQNKCQSLWPGWWETTPPDNNTTFPLNDSKFADAIHDFMQTLPEYPYNMQGTETPDYIPPKTAILHAETNGNGQLSVYWSDRIWQDLPMRWDEWSKFHHFEVTWSHDGNDWEQTDTTSDFSYTLSPADGNYYVKVRAVSSTGKTGTWSDIIQSVEVPPSQTNWKFITEYDTLYADPDMTNLITIKNIDEPIELNNLNISIKGNGKLLNTLPANAASIEKLWKFDNTGEIYSISQLINLKSKGGILSANVTNDEPSDPYFFLNGSDLNGDNLKYISLRIYSSIEATGDIFWWLEGGDFQSFSFPLAKGWQTIALADLPGWGGNIEKIRIDPGNQPHATIMMDWVAISSQPISDKLVTEILLPQRKEVTLLTSPDSTTGSYTINVEYNGIKDSITVVTTLQNKIPSIVITSPVHDTIIEKGSHFFLTTQTADKDGRISHVIFYANGSPFYETFSEPFHYEGYVDVTGNYTVTAEVFDNANATAVSNTLNISIIEQTPFNNEIHIVPGVVEAEDYDEGGQKIAYFDKDDINEGGSYRNDGVDIGKNPNNYDGYFVGWTENGEWLEYTIESKINMKATITVWVASIRDDGELHFEIDDRTATPHQFVPNTGSESVYKKLVVKDIPIRKGVQRLKLYIDKGGFNINKLEIKRYNSKYNRPISEYCLRVFPNPASNELRFMYKEPIGGRMEIFNMLGVKVADKFLDAKYLQIVDISRLPYGAYFIRVTFDDCNVLQNRFVKY